MPIEVILPRVDMDMEAGKINRWFVAEGEAVAKGKPLFEIETDKAAMEIEAPADGVLRGARQIGESFAVGTVVGWICAPGEVVEAQDALTAPADMPSAATAARQHERTSVEARVDGGFVRATPKARRLAREQGVELASLTGSGPDGRIQAKDIASIRGPLATGQRPLYGEWLARGSGVPIVFLHGFGADLNTWRPLHGYLETGRGLYALDLPGHGQSELAGPATLETFVEAIETTLAAEGVSAAHVVGHSLGGAVAAAFAARLPAHVRSLTLLSPAGLGPEFNGAFVKGFLIAQSEASLTPWVRELAVDEAALGAAMVKATLALRSKRPLIDAQTRIAASFFPDGTQAVSSRADIGRYGGPVRVVFGLEDRIIPAAQARGLPGSVAMHFMPSVGHMPHFEARRETAQIVDDNVAAGDRRFGPLRPR